MTPTHTHTVLLNFPATYSCTMVFTSPPTELQQFTTYSTKKTASDVPYYSYRYYSTTLGQWMRLYQIGEHSFEQSVDIGNVGNLPEMTLDEDNLQLFAGNAPACFYDVLGLVCGCGPDVTACLKFEMYGNESVAIIQKIVRHNQKFDLYFTLGTSPWTSPLQALFLYHKVRAYSMWTIQVGPNQPWYRKPIIQTLFDKRCKTVEKCKKHLTMRGKTTK